MHLVRLSFISSIDAQYHCCLSLLERQDERHSRSSAEVALHCDLPFVLIDEMLDDWQAETCSFDRIRHRLLAAME